MKAVIRSIGLALAMVTSASVWTGCSGDRTHRSTGEVIDDTALKTKIKAALVNDPETHAMAISVNVDRGDVILSGFVDNAHERKKAEDISWGVNGVRSVKNNLEVKQ